MTDSKPFRVEVTVDAPPDVVRSALTEPARIREWFGWDYDGLDAEITYIFVDHATRDGDRVLMSDDSEGGQYVEIEADGPRTIVRAVKPGPLGDTDWDEIYDDIAEGWLTFFQQLRFLLERAPDGRRRTVYLTGTTTGRQAVAVVPVKEQWYAGRFQWGGIDGAGHLVTVHAREPVDGGAPAPVAVTVSTYGLDDEAFAAVREEWANRWRALAADGEVTP